MKANYILKRTLAFFFDYFTVNLLAASFIVMTATEKSQKLLDYWYSESNTMVWTEEFNDLASDMMEARANDALYILMLYVIYYVILAKILGGRTLGCQLFSQKIVKNDGSKLTHSDLTVRMLFTNLGMFELITVVIFTFLGSSFSLAILLSSFLVLVYFCFILTNLVFLFSTSTSLVDKMTKSRPLIILRKREI